MAVIVDRNGRVWSVHRDWWPFPGDVLDFTDLLAVLVGLVFVALWPFWLLAKFAGVRWVVVIECDGHEVGRERVRGWRAAERRVSEILLEVTTGARGGHFMI
ncbi:hypothetical protein [Mycobacterium sp. IDR2000157661]|uniref:hypothetical protein n=1 Tax=Mycobacterium sp. IDR2000157661 TaxID=2867005 RepID=UPI001EE9DAA9|nr:hypothetical protein [Mycobacterium sp. IDR2000157661]ULE32841.1 hypothetical protein K3G64_22650 [Mycobacterium sp. IDR2000157661]